MTVEFRRLALLATLFTAAGLLAACGKPATVVPDAGEDPGCLDSTDCPGTDLFYCDEIDSTCKPSCRAKADCTAEVRGEFALDYCAGNLGCQCDEGSCVASLCSADVDCGASGTCRNGACIPTAPAASEVTRCQITPDYVVASQGANVKFWVSTWKGNEPHVVKDGITWTPALPLAGTGAGTSATLNVMGSNTAAATALTVTVGTATCTARVLAHAPVGANTLRISVTDELSGRPVDGARVQLSDSVGASIGGAAAQTTGVDGKAEFATGGGMPNLVTISVFHTDFNYLTIANYDRTGTATRDISAVIRRHATANYGGYKGTFKNVPVTPHIKLGIAGMSIAGSVTDLSISQLLGPTEPTNVVIGSFVNRPDVPLPGGAFLQYDTNQIKPGVSAQGLAGVCATESQVLTGTCGTRSAWGLAGDIPLAEISGAASSLTGGVNQINYGQLLSQILPVFRRFNSSVTRDVEFTLKPTPGADTGDPVFTDRSTFVTVDHDFQQIPLGFNFVVQAPDLPQFKNTFVDGLILLGGTNVPGRGVVPLGLGVAVNTTPPDNKTDKQGETATPGLITMRMAPTHSGLEGSQYGIIALAASLKSATDSTAGLATSAIYERIPGNKLSFDPKGNTKVALTGPFLGLPETAVYNFLDTTYDTIPPRTFRFTSTQSFGGATVLRVTFTDRREHRWVVYVNPTAPTFALPIPGGTFENRTYSDLGLTTGPRSTMLISTMKLADEAGAEIKFNGLVEMNSTNADRLIDFTRAFTVYDYARPSVSFITPANGATTYAAPLKVKISRVVIGTNATDHKVRIDCGTSAFSFGDTDTSQGKGEVTIATLPAGCDPATNKTLTATLVKSSDNNPILPVAKATITIP